MVCIEGLSNQEGFGYAGVQVSGVCVVLCRCGLGGAVREIY